MLIACLVVVMIFLIFIVATYFATKKSCVFDFNGKKIKFENSGSYSKIFIDDKLIQTHHMPQLIYGEEFKVTVDAEEVVLKCKCNGFGNKLSIKAYVGEQEIFNNGVVLKKKK